MSKHEAIGADEVFIGNSDRGVPENISHLKTVRLGSVALDIDGKRLPAWYRPLIINRAEESEYDRVMNASFSGIRR